MSGDNPSASERFPDLYALLGLEALEPDRARIQQSLKRLASQIQARSQTAAKDAPSRAQIERARKLFELGKQQLLEPARKARYDQQWQAVYGVVAATVRSEKQTAQKPRELSPEKQSPEKQQLATVDRPSVAKKPASVATTGRSSVQTWDLRELQALLPAGDPSAPFRPEEYVASRASGVAARYAEDFDKLLSLLAPESTSDQPVVQPAMLPQPPPSPLAQRLRKKQGPPLLWRAIGVLAAVGIVLGIAYWRLQPTSNQSANDPSLAAKPDQDASSAQPAVGDLPNAAQQPATREAAPRRSGLPSVPGIEAIMPTGDASPEAAATGASADIPPAISGMQDAATQDTGMTNPPAMEGAEAQTSSLSDEDRQQWTAGMVAARNAIGQQQFAQATAQLDSLRALAKTQLQTQQLTRLVTIEQLAQRFRQALDRALAGMRAADSFSFGNSNLASFVEADAERVILRIEGRNQTFAMPELPIEVALAIVDLAMDREHPQSLAAKAAFIMVHPAAQGDDRAVQQARQMMATAVAAQAVSQDMQQALQDDFELP